MSDGLRNIKTPTTGTALRDAVDRAVSASERKKALRDSCPSCTKRAALISLVFRGIRLGRICRFCPHVEMVDFDRTKPERTAKKEVEVA